MGQGGLASHRARRGGASEIFPSLSSMVLVCSLSRAARVLCRVGLTALPCPWGCRTRFGVNLPAAAPKVFLRNRAKAAVLLTRKWAEVGAQPGE